MTYTYTDDGLIDRANEGKVQPPGPPQEIHRVQRQNIEVGQEVTALCGLTFTVSIVYRSLSDRARCPYCFPERPKYAIAA